MDPIHFTAMQILKAPETPDAVDRFYEDNTCEPARVFRNAIAKFGTAWSGWRQIAEKSPPFAVTHPAE